MQKISIIGSLGRDAEQKEINGKTFIIFSLAEKGSRNQETTWYNVLYRTDRDALLNYLKSGQMIYAEGRLSAKTYQAKDGSWKVDLTIFANELQLCGGKAENNAPAAAPSVPRNSASAPSAPAAEAKEEDEDLPF